LRRRLTDFGEILPIVAGSSISAGRPPRTTISPLPPSLGSGRRDCARCSRRSTKDKARKRAVCRFRIQHVPCRLL